MEENKKGNEICQSDGNSSEGSDNKITGGFCVEKSNEVDQKHGRYSFSKIVLFLSPIIVALITVIILNIFFEAMMAGLLFIFLPTAIIYTVSVIFYLLAIKKQRKKYYYLFVSVFASMLLLVILLPYIVLFLIHPLLLLLYLLFFALPSIPLITYNVVIFVLFVDKKYYVKNPV